MPSSSDATLLHGGLALALPLAALIFPETKVRFVLRPSWCPAPWIIRAAKMGTTRTLFKPWVLAEASLLLASAPHFMMTESVLSSECALACYQVMAALGFGLHSLVHWATVGTHFEILPVWGAIVLALNLGPRPTRTLLRVLCAHHIGAAGWTKLAVGTITHASLDASVTTIIASKHRHKHTHNASQNL